MGLETPSPYNSINLDKHKTSSPKYGWNSKTKRIAPLIKTAAGMPEVSPAVYKPDESL